MSLHETVSAERLHIGFFGMRNAGKSSLVNALTNQQLAVVSDIPGTTTDPVLKAMELLPLGPVVIMDTPGLDDVGELGELRVQKTRQMLAKTDIAVLVADASKGLVPQDRELLTLLEERKLPHLLVFNKADLVRQRTDGVLYTSTQTLEGIEALKERLGALAPKKATKKIVADKLQTGDTVVLVIPIDESAPKGRIILPQQLTLRELLDHRCTVVACQDTELAQTLDGLRKPPALIITDSQAFGRVAKETPDGVPLTSFSILFARYKGDLTTLVKGASVLSKLKDGDPVLICEGCTHHRQCNDIGTVKLPAWIEAHSKAKPQFSFTSGGTYPDNLSAYRLIVHCGGCMLNETEMQHRIAAANEAGVPIVNYGIAIAQMNGILKRSLTIFPEIEELLTCKN